MPKIMESQIFNSQQPAGARECGADCVGRIGEYSLCILRHRLNDCERLRREVAVDVIAFLVTGMLHVADKDPVLVQIIPS